MAFSRCHQLREVRLNEGLRKLGWLCLLWTGVAKVELPQQIKMTSKQLGLDQKDQKVLRLPRGLAAVGESWFEGSDIEKLVVPSSVTRLGISAFAHCGRLRDVVFKPSSGLETIDKYCFSYC